MKLGWATVGVVAMELLTGAVSWHFGVRWAAGMCWDTAVFVAVGWLVCEEYLKVRRRD